MLTRRHLITTGAGLVVGGSDLALKSLTAAAASINRPSALPEGTRSNTILDALPGKKPLLKLSYRPPNYETRSDSFAPPSPRLTRFSSAITSPLFRRWM